MDEFEVHGWKLHAWRMVLASTAFAAIISSRQVFAAEPAKVPRYRLMPGQEMRYSDTSESISGKTDLSKEYGETDWKVWVVRAGSDGTWRLVVSMQSWRGSKKGKKDAQPGNEQLVAANLFPDGRITFDDQYAEELVPIERLFPRLPPDAKSLAGGWDDSRQDGFEQCSYKLNENQSLGDRWVFDEVRVDGWDKIYDATAHDIHTFDLDRGLIESSEEQFTWGNGFDEKGAVKTKFISVENHSVDWTKSFAKNADQYFAVMQEHEDLVRSAEHDADRAQSLIAQAEKAMKTARTDLKQTIFGDRLDRKLPEFSRQSKWIIEEANAYAAHFGKPAADWKLVDLSGKSHSMADYRGKVVLLDFWYRGCGWCMRAMPTVEQLAHDYDGRPVAFLGMNTDPDKSDARSVVDVMHLTYPVLSTTMGAVPKDYGVSVYPTFVVIDQKGVVREIRVGYSKTLRTDLSKSIDRLLDAKQ